MRDFYRSCGWVMYLRSGGLHLIFNCIDLHPLLLHAQLDLAKCANVEVRHEYQREKRNQVSPPVVIQELVARDQEKEDGHVVAEAVFAGEEVKELATNQAGMALALPNAVLARLAEDLFVGHRPGDARYGDGQQDQPDHLMGYRHTG